MHCLQFNKRYSDERQQWENKLKKKHEHKLNTEVHRPDVHINQF